MEKLQKLFSTLPDVDAVVVTSQNNRLYFTKFSGTFGILVLTREGANYITDFRYFEMAKDAMKDSGIDVFLSEGGLKAYDTAKELLENMENTGEIQFRVIKEIRIREKYVHYIHV